MATESSIQQVYEGVCQALGAMAEPLEPDAFGQLGFELRLGEITVHVAATPPAATGASPPAPGLLLMVEFGQPARGQEQETFARLLEANLVLAAAGGPVFARSPVDGCLVLQHSCHLAGMTGAGLHTLAQRLALLARAWRAEQGQPAPSERGAEATGGCSPAFA